MLLQKVPLLRRVVRSPIPPGHFSLADKSGQCLSNISCVATVHLSCNVGGGLQLSAIQTLLGKPVGEALQQDAFQLALEVPFLCGLVCWRHMPASTRQMTSPEHGEAGLWPCWHLDIGNEAGVVNFDAQPGIQKTRGYTTIATLLQCPRQLGAS